MEYQNRVDVLALRLFVGLAMMFIGAWLFLGRLGFVPLVLHPAHILLNLWPLLMIVLGVLFLAFPRRPGAGGAWLILVGLLVLAHAQGVMTLDRSWPLFVIAGGIAVVFNAVRQPEVHRGQ